MRQTGEPTVEEILESIKKVIARDNRSNADENRPREHEALIESDVLPEDEVYDEDQEEDVLDLAEESALADESGIANEAPLLTENAQSSMRESLAALALLSEPRALPQIVRSGETSLEGLARELLRPALAEWLDKNLPPLVERMVAVEIARIVGKRG